MADWRDAIVRELAAQGIDRPRPDVVEELALHAQAGYDDLRAAGATSDDAEREAVAELTRDAAALREFIREPRTSPRRSSLPIGAAATAIPGGGRGSLGLGAGLRFGAIGHDLRVALRSLRLSPGFAFVAVFTLALGIGANTAIFGLLDAVLLRPLPFADADRLVRVRAVKDGTIVGARSPLDIRDFARENQTFEQLVTYDAWRKNVSLTRGGPDSAQPEQLTIGLVPAAYFEALGIRPLMGRLFTGQENQFGSHYVAAISRSFWQHRFDGDPSILGRTMRINDEPYTIVAVMPDVLPAWLDARAVWTPFVTTADQWSEHNRGALDYSAIGRVKAGVSLEQAQADLARIAAGLAGRYPADRGLGVAIEPLVEMRAGALRPVLRMLMGAVTLVLLIACSNMANLLLARHTGRQRELAIRTALGASRAALLRHRLAETLVLSCLGGGLGVLLAWLGNAALLRLAADRMPQIADSRLDLRVLLFTSIVSIATGLLVGLAPAAGGLRGNLVEVLRQGGRTGTASRHRRRLGRLIVMSEMALSLMLLIGAGLLVQSLSRLDRQEMGFQPDHLLKAHFFLPPVRYVDPASITRFAIEFAGRVRALPGVREATVTTMSPPATRWMRPFRLEGQSVSRVEELPRASFGVTDERYRATIGTPLVRGRDFSAADTESAQPVALVNETFVRQFLSNGDPIGRRFWLGPSEPLVAGASGGGGVARLTVVGVIADTKNRGLASPPGPEIVTLFRQMPDANFGFKDVLVRTAADPYAMTEAIRATLHGLDPNLPLAEVASMEDVMARQASDRRVTTLLLGLFAALGVALAIVGLYGVVSYLVSQRTQEIGLRVALGADRADILWLVIRHALATTLGGVAAGLLGAWMFSQLLAQLVFGISSVDAATYVLAASLLVLVALGASLVPGVRALRIDPLTALRSE
jgi:putative ABC transport system permease protein